MTMEHSRNMIKHWPKVIEFCDQSWTKFVLFSPTLGIFKSIRVESLPFLTVFAKRRKFEQGYNHRKARNGQGKVTKKHVFKSVGTLYVPKRELLTLLDSHLLNWSKLE